VQGGVFKFSSSSTSEQNNSSLLHHPGVKEEPKKGVPAVRKGISFYVGFEGTGKSTLARRHRRTLSIGAGRPGPRQIWQMPQENIKSIERRMENLSINTSLRSLDSPAIFNSPSSSNSNKNEAIHVRRVSAPEGSRKFLSGNNNVRHFAMMKRAEIQRRRIINVKRLRLQIVNHSVSQLGQLKEKRDHILRLTLKARMEIEMESASIRRQIVLERQVEKFKMYVTTYLYTIQHSIHYNYW
jgi:hypothetical protein